MDLKKELGQHFLTDRHVAQSIVKSALVTKDDTVLEIGGGTGILTQYLAARAKKLIVVELDSRFVQLLSVRFLEEKHVQVIRKNILDFSPPAYGLEKRSYCIVGSLPYNISKQIVKKFLEEDMPPARLTVVLQKEVAEDYLAQVPKATFLSNYLQIWGQARRGQIISRAEFHPVPKVDGEVLHIKTHTVQEAHPHFYSKFLKSAFLNPRKKLVNNLAAIYSVSKEALLKEFTAYDIRSDARASMLTFRQWHDLFTFLHSKS